MKLYCERVVYETRIRWCNNGRWSYANLCISKFSAKPVEFGPKLCHLISHLEIAVWFRQPRVFTLSRALDQSGINWSSTKIDANRR